MQLMLLMNLSHKKGAEICLVHNPLQKRIIHTHIFQIYWHDLHLPSMTSLLSKVGFLFYQQELPGHQK